MSEILATETIQKKNREKKPEKRTKQKKKHH